jgi:hypothetical protein
MRYHEARAAKIVIKVTWPSSFQRASRRAGIKNGRHQEWQASRMAGIKNEGSKRMTRMQRMHEQKHWVVRQDRPSRRTPK